MLLRIDRLSEGGARDTPHSSSEHFLLTYPSSYTDDAYSTFKACVL